MTAAVSELLAWVTGGSALAALGKVLIAVCALILGLIYRRYLGILGADPSKPAERREYDALRDGLTRGNTIADLYAATLTRFLNQIDRFFGDAGLAGRTLFLRAFGLKTPAPLWTAPAFDRSLLLVMVYSFVVTILIWVISGSPGASGQALHLAPNAGSG